jgi:hypothetical protein
MTKQEQVEPESRATVLESDDPYAQLVAAIDRKWPADEFTWRAHFTPAGGTRPCVATLDVQRNGGEHVGSLEAHAATPAAVYGKLRQLVEQTSLQAAGA